MLEKILEKIGKNKFIQVGIIASVLSYSSMAIAKPRDYLLTKPKADYSLKLDLEKERKRNYLGLELKLEMEPILLASEPCPPYLDPDLCWEKGGEEKKEKEERPRKKESKPAYEPSPSYEPSYSEPSRKSNKDNDVWGYILTGAGVITFVLGASMLDDGTYDMDGTLLEPNETNRALAWPVMGGGAVLTGFGLYMVFD